MNGAAAMPAGSGREDTGAQAAVPVDLAERLLCAECKVVDFGNACWVHKQFTSDIQTRQYRCPEARQAFDFLKSYSFPLLSCLMALYELRVFSVAAHLRVRAFLRTDSLR